MSVYLPDKVPHARLKQYLLTGPVGVGRVGLVLSAIHEVDGQPRVLHVPYLRYQERLGFGPRYLSDALWAATSGLEGFCLPIQCDCSDDLVFSVRTLLKGVSLKLIIRHMRARRARISRRIITSIGLQLATALHELHNTIAGEPGVPPCHGRINPGRVLLQGDGSLSILGMPAPGGWMEGSWLTPLESTRLCELPPELLDGHPFTPASDIYQLCLLLYTMWVLHNPYDQHTRRGTLQAIFSGVPLLRDSMYLGQPLRELLLTGLADTPDQRPSMPQVIHLLKESLKEDGGPMLPQALAFTLQSSLPTRPPPPEPMLHPRDTEMLLSLLRSR